MKTMQEYLDEVADMVTGTDPRLAVSAHFGADTASVRVHSPAGKCLGELTITVKGDRPEFDMEHACLYAGYLAGVASVRLGNTETMQ